MSETDKDDVEQEIERASKAHSEFLDFLEGKRDSVDFGASEIRLNPPTKDTAPKT